MHYILYIMNIIHYTVYAINTIHYTVYAINIPRLTYNQWSQETNNHGNGQAKGEVPQIWHSIESLDADTAKVTRAELM